MPRSRLAVASAMLLLVGCDLPNTPQEARERLARGQDRTVTVEAPVPGVTVKMSRLLNRFDDSGKIDQNTMSVSMTPSPIRVDIGEFLEIDPVDPAPTAQSFDMSVRPYRQVADVEGDAVDLTLDDAQESAAVGNAGPGTLELPPVDYRDDFSSATFARGSVLRIRLTTNGATSLQDVSAVIRAPGGPRLAASVGRVNAGPGSAVAVDIPLEGVTLPGRFAIELDHGGTSGDGDANALRATIGFVDAAIRSAVRVNAGRVTPTTIEEWVVLTSSSDEFSEAVLETGGFAILSSDFGSLVFTPGTAEFNLAGKRVGGAAPDSVYISGTIAAPAGATHLDVDTRGKVTADVRNVTVRSVTLYEVDERFTESIEVLDDDDDQFEGIEEVRIDTGAITLEISNRLPIPGQLTLTLAGSRNAQGQVITHTAPIAAASGGGTARTTVRIPLDDATIVPAQLRVDVVGSFEANDVRITREMADDAFVVDPYITMAPRSLRIANPPSLDADIDQLERFSADDLGIGRLADMLEGVHLNDVDLTLELRNRIGIPLSLQGLTITLVTGANPTPVLDDEGRPISVLVQQGSTGTFTVAANSTESVTMRAALLMNELIQRVLAGENVGLQTTGAADFSRSSGTISATDFIEMTVSVHAPLDITIPAGGVTLEETVHSAVTPPSRPAKAAAELGENLESAQVRMRFTNSTPVGVTVSVAIAPTPSNTSGFDPFKASQRLVITDVQVPAATVDALGRVTAPAEVVRTVDVPAQDLGVFTKGAVSVGARVLMVPGPQGRARFTSDNFVSVVPTLIGQVSTQSATRAGGN